MANIHTNKMCVKGDVNKMSGEKKKMSLGGKVMVVGVVLYAIGAVVSTNDKSTGQAFLTISGCVLFYGFIGWLIGRSRRKKREAYEALSPEEKSEVDAKKKAEAEQMAQFYAQAAEDRAQGKTIVSTAIVDSTAKSKTKASATSSVVRGAVGGAVFGPIGLVAGAVTPKKKTITKNKDVTFAILYANGKRDLEKVKVGSKRYNELAKYLA